MTSVARPGVLGAFQVLPPSVVRRSRAPTPRANTAVLSDAGASCAELTSGGVRMRAKLFEPASCDDVDIPGAGRKPEHSAEREPVPARAAVVRGIEQSVPRDEGEAVEPVGETKLGSHS